MCNCGSQDIEVIFSQWRTVAYVNGGRPVNERVNPLTNTLNFHGAADDPLTRIELGLQDRAGDSGIRTFSPEQQCYFLEKLITDKDSKKLREEVLQTRKENQSRARNNVQQATSTTR